MTLLCLVLCAAVLLPGARAEVELQGHTYTFPGDVTDGNARLVEVGEEDRFDYNIRNDDGTYQYGYQSGRLEEDGGYSFKHEYKDKDGILYGQHGYELPGGLNKTVSYVADARGYRVLGDGDVYTPVSERQLQRQRDLLGEAADLSGDGENWDSTADEEPLILNLEHLALIKNPEMVSFESDPSVLLAAVPLETINEFNPDTGAARLRYRTVDDSGAVSFRMEERRPVGIVIGQYGHRESGERGSVITYVSDAFGHRIVDPSQPVPVVSRDRALAELPEEVLSESEPKPEPEPMMMPMAAAEESEMAVTVAGVESMLGIGAHMSMEPETNMGASMSTEASDSESSSSAGSDASSGGYMTGSEDGAVVAGAPETIEGAAISPAAVETAEAVLSLTGGNTILLPDGQYRPSLLQMLQPQDSSATAGSAYLSGPYIPYYSYNYQPVPLYGEGSSYYQQYQYAPPEYNGSPYANQPSQDPQQQYQSYWYPYSTWYPYAIYNDGYMYPAQAPSTYGQYPTWARSLNVPPQAENE